MKFSIKSNELITDVPSCHSSSTIDINMSQFHNGIYFIELH